MDKKYSIQDLEKSLEDRKEWYDESEGICKAGKFFGKTALYSLAYLGVRNLMGADIPEEFNSPIDYVDAVATCLGVLWGLAGACYTFLGASEKKGYRKEIEKLESIILQAQFVDDSLPSSAD